MRGPTERFERVVHSDDAVGLSRNGFHVLPTKNLLRSLGAVPVELCIIAFWGLRMLAGIAPIERTRLERPIHEACPSRAIGMRP